MKIVSTDRSHALKFDDAAVVGDSYRLAIVDGLSETFRASVHYFEDGATNILHKHTGDQIIFIIDGEGVVKTETEEVFVKKDDAVFFPAGEIHSHCARPGHSMAQFGILSVKPG